MVYPFFGGGAMVFSAYRQARDRPVLYDTLNLFFFFSWEEDPIDIGILFCLGQFKGIANLIVFL